MANKNTENGTPTTNERGGASVGATEQTGSRGQPGDKQFTGAGGRTDQPMGQPWSSGKEHLDERGQAGRSQRGRFYSAAQDRSSGQRMNANPPVTGAGDSSRMGQYGASRDARFDRSEVPGYLPGTDPGRDDRLGRGLDPSGYGERLAAGYGNDTGFAAEGRFEPDGYDTASDRRGIRRGADQDERFEGGRGRFERGRFEGGRYEGGRTEDHQASMRAEWSPRARTDLGDRAIGFTPGRGGSVGTTSGAGFADRGYPMRDERMAYDNADRYGRHDTADYPGFREGRTGGLAHRMYEGGHEHRTPGGTQNTRNQGGPMMGLDSGPTVHRNRGSGLLDRMAGGGRWEREGLTARDVMTKGPKSIRPEATLREVAQFMETEDVGAVPVCDANNRLLGIVTDRDLVVRAFKDDKTPSSLKVSDVMTDDIEAVTPDESVHDIIELMGAKQIRRVPVVDKDDRLLGIISMGDIATRADFDEDLQDALQRISGRRSFWSRMFS